MKVCNAFSINMVKFDFMRMPMVSVISPLSLSEARDYASEGVESCVGHADTASVMGDALGVSLPMNRTTVALEDGEVILVGQYIGPRLEEGTTTLPEGARIDWFRVEMFSVERMESALRA